MTEMALNGRLEDTPLAEVAGRLFQNSKTGRLVLTSNERSRQVVFYEGSPVAVLSDDPKDHIGHFLTLKGKVSHEEGARLQELPETKEALQAADFLTKEVLTWGLKFRFVNLAYDLFRWDEGTWSFEESPPPKDVFLMKVPTPTLVAKGVKYMSPSLLMKRIPSDRVIGPGTLSRDEAAFLSDEERALLEHCTEGKRIQEVIEAEVADPVRTRELFYVLLALGLVSAATPTPEAPPEAVVDDVAEETPEDLIFSPEEPAAPPEEPAAPPEEAEESFEIERHTYGEPEMPAAEGKEEKPALTGAEEELQPEAPAPPAGLEMPETLQPLGGEEELEAPGLEMPAPPETEAKAPLSPEASRFIDPDEAPPLQEGGELEPPGLEIPPPPSPDLPPPPWQESTDPGGADDTFSLREDEGSPGGGQSPFAPPEPSSGSEEPPPRKRPSAGKAAPKRKPAIPSRLMLLLAAVGAAVVVGAGVYVGSQSFRSPSTPLPPIPAAEEVQPEMAENLPVPALPGTVRKKEVQESSEPEPSQTPAPPPVAVQLPASAPPPPPAPEPESPTAPPSASGATYESGLAAFQGGDYQGAAVLWREMLAGGAETHSVSVVVACQIDTVKGAFTSYGADRKIFAIPLKLSDGRDCFRVCMGLFGSKGEAQAAVKALPPTLRSDLQMPFFFG
jgi:hypothetical protein